MSGPLEIGDLPPVLVNQEASFEPVREAILELREKVEDLCNQELTKINKQGPQIGGFFSSSAFCPFSNCLNISFGFSCSQRHNDVHFGRL